MHDEIQDKSRKKQRNTQPMRRLRPFFVGPPAKRQLIGIEIQSELFYRSRKETQKR